MEYIFSSSDPRNHFLEIETKISDINTDKIVLQLPAWRPGRYELGNFAKNIRDFRVEDLEGNRLKFTKLTKDSWEVETSKAKDVKVIYSYYAAELNAGSTYLDESQMYVNPVNCCLYALGKEDEECVVELITPDSYEVATAMAMKSSGTNRFVCRNFDELADSPFIASSSLKHLQYSVGNTLFHCWFQGEIKIDEKKLITDFSAFSNYQLEKMGKLPVDEYHFLFQITPTKGYHGVEHLNSTVILLGPSYQVMNEAYVDLLGISSHELFHSWNIKAIRPEEMFPYKFEKENYSRLGYVAEGVTTYIGDRALYESGVYDRTEYQKELINYFKKHYHNAGRWHYDVASSSFDTWLDGYVPGVPGRKVSIYTEGMMVAYICDMRIRQRTDNKSDLLTVMKKLYEITDQKQGYTEDIYKLLLEETAGCSFDDIYSQLVYGVNSFDPFLEEAMAFDGMLLLKKENPVFHENYGFKGIDSEGGFDILQVLERSAAGDSGLVEGDKIVGVNGLKTSGDLTNWMKYFKEDGLELTISRNSVIRTLKMSEPTDEYFFELEIQDI